MIKYYCDGCGNELEAGEHRRIKKNLWLAPNEDDRNLIGVEVIHSMNGTSNSGHICHWCLLKVLNGGSTI
jgi:hypothetical protein